MQRKITLYAGSCFLLLFVALLGAIYWEMERTVVPLNESLTEQIVQARSEQISYWFEQRIGEIELVAAIGAEHGWKREDLLRELSKLSSMRSDEYESIRVVDADGISWLTGSKPFSIVNREYYKRMLETDAPYVVSNVIESHANKAEIVVILYRLPPVDQAAAYIAAAVPIGKMKEIAQEIVVYDGMGQLLDEDTVFQQVDWQTDGHSEIESEEMHTFSAPVEHLPGWKLMFEVPESQLSFGTTRTQSSALKVGCVVGLFFFMLILVLARSIVRPIRSLQGLMSKVEAGNWNVRANEDKRDEIGELGRSFNQMLVKLYHYEQEKKEMELRLIQEQIKPHFLYNTLDTIQWQAGAHGADDVVEMVEALSTYFRLGLGNDSQFVTLEQEFHHVESYLHIQCVRYEELVEYELMYEEHLGDKAIVRFLLQPLVENAIYHGIKPLSALDRKRKISIQAYEEQACMYLIVENNGADIAEERLRTIEAALASSKWKDGTIGFGLYSVNHRLKLAYGEPYGLHVTSGGGITRMTIVVPLEGGGSRCGRCL